jgi:hypothetical protein
MRTARSHAVKRALQKKRKKLVQQLDHFKNMTIHDGSIATLSTSLNLSMTIDVQKLDPFESLPVNASKLQVLLGHRMSTRL